MIVAIMLWPMFHGLKVVDVLVGPNQLESFTAKYFVPEENRHQLVDLVQSDSTSRFFQYKACKLMYNWLCSALYAWFDKRAYRWRLSKNIKLFSYKTIDDKSLSPVLQGWSCFKFVHML